MIVINGEASQIEGGLTVHALLERLDLPDPQWRGVAVAIGDEVVPRGEWASSVVPDEARVEVVRAVQGG